MFENKTERNGYSVLENQPKQVIEKIADLAKYTKCTFDEIKRMIQSGFLISTQEYKGTEFIYSTDGLITNRAIAEVGQPVYFIASEIDAVINTLGTTDFTVNYVGSRKGEKGDAGVDGTSFNIFSGQRTIAELPPFDVANLNDGFIITDDPNTTPPEVALYYKATGGTTWDIITPFNGTQGPRGEKGEQGIQGEKGEKGDKGIDGTGEYLTTAMLSTILGNSLVINTNTISVPPGHTLQVGDLIRSQSNPYLGICRLVNATTAEVQTIQYTKGDKGDKGDPGSTAMVYKHSVTLNLDTTGDYRGYISLIVISQWAQKYNFQNLTNSIYDDTYDDHTRGVPASGIMADTGGNFVGNVGSLATPDFTNNDLTVFFGNMNAQDGAQYYVINSNVQISDTVMRII